MRYERKYKIEYLTFPVVTQIIHAHPASFRKIYPDRQVNNIYFDTPDLTTYKENVMGIARRKKFRLRWYGNDFKVISNANFEIKYKDNQLGRKKVEPIDSVNWTQLERSNNFFRHLIPSNNCFYPSLLNTYRRAYYGTSNGKFRITIDTQLAYFSLLIARKFTSFTLKDTVVILELKYDESLDDQADSIMQYLPFRQTKSSKYITGVDVIINQ